MLNVTAFSRDIFTSWITPPKKVPYCVPLCSTIHDFRPDAVVTLWVLLPLVMAHVIIENPSNHPMKSNFSSAPTAPARLSKIETPIEFSEVCGRNPSRSRHGGIEPCPMDTKPLLQPVLFACVRTNVVTLNAFMGWEYTLRARIQARGEAVRSLEMESEERCPASATLHKGGRSARECTASLMRKVDALLATPDPKLPPIVIPAGFGPDGFDFTRKGSKKVCFRWGLCNRVSWVLHMLL